MALNGDMCRDRRGEREGGQGWKGGIAMRYSTPKHVYNIMD